VMVCHGCSENSYPVGVAPAMTYHSLVNHFVVVVDIVVLEVFLVHHVEISRAKEEVELLTVTAAS
jgi:hypothetical protein